MTNNFCVIMAGGVGSRFWPLSRTVMPKQFLDILGTGRTFIQQTYDRFAKIIPAENFLVVTSVKYKDLVLEQLPELKEEQILLEPLRRNTAPCLAYAANKIKIKSPDANVIVTPSDHLILKEDEFIIQLKNGLDFVSEKEALLTLGIKPNRPETGYGYIQVKKRKEFKDLDNLYKVKTFTEKPDEEMAQIFVDSGEFYWNSGIFISSLATLPTQNLGNSPHQVIPPVRLLQDRSKTLVLVLFPDLRVEIAATENHRHITVSASQLFVGVFTTHTWHGQVEHHAVDFSCMFLERV